MYVEIIVACIVIFLLISTRSALIYKENESTGKIELNIKALLLTTVIIVGVWSFCYRFLSGNESIIQDE